MRGIKYRLIISILLVFIFCIVPQNIYAASQGKWNRIPTKPWDVDEMIEELEEDENEDLTLNNVMNDFDAKPEDTINIGSTKTLRKIIGKFLGVLQLLTGLFTVIILVVTGFDYVVMATPDVKAEIKKTMLPIIIGMMLVFSATTITQFIFKALE